MLHALLFLLKFSSNSTCFFIQNACLFNSVGYSAGKSLAGLLMVMLACLRGVFVSNLHRRDLACPACPDLLVVTLCDYQNPIIIWGVP